MKLILIGVVALILASGCAVAKTENINSSMLVHSAEFMTVDNSILDDDKVYAPFRLYYDSTSNTEHLVDLIGRVVDAQGTAIYKTHKDDRNKTFDEVPMILPLITKWITNDIGNAAIMKMYDQLGREIKFQAL